jgi:hypothetical protein
MMIAALILMTGVLAVAGAMSTSVIGSKNSRDIVRPRTPERSFQSS